MNLNLLWASPLHFPLVLILGLRYKRLLGWYFRVYALLYLLLLIFWSFLPQDLHFSLIPLVLLLLVRCVYAQHHQLAIRYSAIRE